MCGTSSVKKTTSSSSSSGVVGAKSANCSIKNTATENAMSKSTQSIFEKALASNNGKGLSTNEMSQSLKNSGINATSSIEQGDNADRSYSNKQYIDIKDEDGKTYRLWDNNGDKTINASDFNNQLSDASSSIKGTCSGSGCNKTSGGCNKTSDSGTSGGCNKTSGGCNKTSDSGSSGGCNKTSNGSDAAGDTENSSGSGLLDDVKAMLIARNPDLANSDKSSTGNNSTDSNSSALDTLANQKISEAKSALGSGATNADILKYVSDDLNGKHTTAANTTSTNATSTNSTATDFTRSVVP